MEFLNESMLWPSVVVTTRSKQHYDDNDDKKYSNIVHNSQLSIAVVIEGDQCYQIKRYSASTNGKHFSRNLLYLTIQTHLCTDT